MKWLLERFPLVEGAMAFTLGHTVFGAEDAALDISHGSRMVLMSVEFERWGPLMGPAYLGCSLVLWLTAADLIGKSLRAAGIQAGRRQMMRSLLSDIAISLMKPPANSPGVNGLLRMTGDKPRRNARVPVSNREHARRRNRVLPSAPSLLL